MSAHGGTLLTVATFAEALPLWDLHPWIAGMGRRNYRLPAGRPVLSAGFAGACQPWLQVGDVILSGAACNELPVRLKMAARSITEPSPAFAARRIFIGQLETVAQIASPEQKWRLGEQGTLAVDMETKWLAGAAREEALAFLSVRVIIDRMNDGALGPATALAFPLAALRLRQAVVRVLELWP